MAPHGPRYKIFFSHASEDKPRLRPLLEALALSGFFEIWIDRPGKGESDFGLTEAQIAAYGIQRIESGDNWKETIDSALRTSHAVLGIISTALTPNRREFWLEFKRAHFQNKLIPWRLEDVDFTRLSDPDITLSDRQSPLLDMTAADQALLWLKDMHAQNVRDDELLNTILLTQQPNCPPQVSAPPPPAAMNFLNTLLRLIQDLKNRSQNTRAEALRLAGSPAAETATSASNQHASGVGSDLPQYGLLCNRHIAEALADDRFHNAAQGPSLQVLHLYGAPHQGLSDFMVRLKRTKQQPWLVLKGRPEGDNPTEQLRSALRSCLREKFRCEVLAHPTVSASQGASAQELKPLRNLVVQYVWDCSTVALYQWWRDRGLPALCQDLAHVVKAHGVSVTLLVGLQCDNTAERRLFGLMRSKSCLEQVREHAAAAADTNDFHELTDLVHLDVDTWFDMLLTTPVQPLLRKPNEQKRHLKCAVFGASPTGDPAQPSCCWDHAQRHFEQFFDQLRHAPMTPRTT